MRLLSNFMASRVLMLFIRALKSHFLRIFIEQCWVPLCLNMMSFLVSQWENLKQEAIFSLYQGRRLFVQKIIWHKSVDKNTQTQQRDLQFTYWRDDPILTVNKTVLAVQIVKLWKLKQLNKIKKNSVLYSFSRLSNVFSHFCGLNLSRNHNEKYRTMKPSSRHFRNLSSSYVMYSNLYCTRATLNLFFIFLFFHFSCFLAKTHYLRICQELYCLLPMAQYDFRLK